MKLTILGAGSFGTAMANHAASLGHDVCLWSRDATQVKTINLTHSNPDYLKEYRLCETLRAEEDFAEAVRFAPKIILAVPAQSLRDVMRHLSSLNFFSGQILSLAKGIEISTGKLSSEIAEEVIPHISYSVLSGPSHAEEVVRDLPTAVVVASRSHETAVGWQKDLNSPHFRIYTGDDLIGVELGGAVKNVIAIAVGIGRGLNFGDNALAALATRGLAEIMRLGAARGASPLTLAGLAGVGDLMVTCYSTHSRNLNFGLAIGKGMTAAEASSQIGQVVEGAHTVKALVAYARDAKVELPIAEGVYAVLYEGASVKQELEKLLFRDPKPERQR